MGLNLAIGVPTHNRHTPLRRLLESIALQSVKPSQVLLVTNDDDETTADLTHKFFDAINSVHLKTGTVGISPARQKILESAHPDTDILYYIDDDCYLDDPNHLKKLLQEHKNQPEALAIGGGYRSTKKNLWDSVYNSTVYFWIQKSLLSEQNKMLPGGNISIKLKLINSDVAFSDAHLFSGEDTDFNLQLQKNGNHLVYLEPLDIPHIPNLGLKQLIQKALLQGKMRQRHHEVNLPKNPRRFPFSKLKIWPIEYFLALALYLPLVYLTTYIIRRK